MQTLPTTIKKNVTLLCFGALLSTLNTAWAESDMQLQEKALKARESIRHSGMDHSEHENSPGTEAGNGFRGVFYGYLPCKEKDCTGLKMTLSLKPKSNYLLVSQPAKPSSREFYEKGKYEWNDKTRILLLTPNKDAPQRQLSIEDDSALVVLSAEGKLMPGDQEAYTLRRSDKSKTREVHIH